MKKDYDAIVIGSGIGALTSACFLAMDGEKVLLVDKNETLGGCMQPISFENERWKWNLGLQWICKFGKHDPDGMMLHHITDGKVEMNPLDKEFQEMVFPEHPDFKFTVISEMGEMEDALIDKFPKEKSRIKKYYHWIRDINLKLFSLPIAKVYDIKKAPKVYSKLLHWVFPWLPGEIGGPLTTTSLATVVEETLGIEDERLKDVLYSYWHFLGMAPEEIPFLFYAVVVGIQEGGVYYPKGGAESIVKAAVETIEGHGGKVLRGHEVMSIKFEDGAASGVHLVKGHENITAKRVVSGIGIRETIENLIPGEHRNDQVREIHEIVKNDLRSVPSILLLRVGLTGDLSKFGIRKATYRSIAGTPWDMTADPRKTDWSPPDVTINFPSFYDNGDLTEGDHTAEVVALTDYDFFKDLDPDTAEFKKMVDRMEEAMVAKMGEFFPGIAKHVVFKQLTTPFDVTDTTGHNRGTIYGLDITKAANMKVQTHSGIENLYFTGEDVFAQGITLTNGLLTAAAMLHMGLVKQFIF